MKINTLYNKDKHFPSKLKELDNVPGVLYYRGRALEDLGPTVAIVGTRKPSNYGIAMAQKFASELAAFGITIASGLALGIDAEAHKGALAGKGRTVAVLPSGLDKTYPRTNAQLGEEIISCGGTLLSEYPIGTAIHRHNFVIRNRIISGLADVVIVIESAASGGSLVTANIALEQGKTVMALPGDITKSQSVGTNELIKNGALLMSSTKDVLLALGLTFPNHSPSVYQARNKNEQAILDLIRNGISSQDQLQISSKLSPQELNRTLTELELSGTVRCIGSGEWIAL